MEYLVIKPFSLNSEEPFPVGTRLQETDLEPHLIQAFLELGNIKELNEEGTVDPDEGETVTTSSELRAPDAIKHLQGLNSVEELNAYVKGDQRTTVQNAANSRRNALLSGKTTPIEG